MNKSFNNAAKEHEVVRCEEEVEVLVTSEQIEKYEQSDDARNVVKLFGSYDLNPCPAVCHQSYCTMCDYLFWQISFQNSHKSGVISNFTLEEFCKTGCEGDLMRI